MNHPQTTAAKYSGIKNLSVIAKYGCCAFGTMWCMGIEPENDIDAIKTIDDAIIAGVIDKDCMVIWNKFLPWLTGRNIEVEFVNISSIKSIKKRTMVRYDYNGCSHWVGVEDGKVAYNSLINSVCVAKGKPVTARIFKINGKQI